MLLEVAGEPLLTHGLRALAALEVEELVIVVGHGAEAVRDRYGTRFEGRPIAYAHQEERKGVAHALLTAAGRVEGPFVALHGDNLFPRGAGQLRPVVERRRKEGLAASLLVERVPPERAVRGVCVTGPDGGLERFVEHPTPGDRSSGLVVAGFYAFSTAIFRACRTIDPSARGEYELPAALTWLLERGHPVAATTLRGVRVNVNTPADLEAARSLAGG